MKRKKSGFTLVEIMIVVAIIGLLAAIGIPSFQTARRNARQKACINNMRMLEAGGEQYMMMNNVASATKVNALTYVKGGTVICPTTGTDTYSLSTDGTNTASCTTHGTIAVPVMGN